MERKYLPHITRMSSFTLLRSFSSDTQQSPPTPASSASSKQRGKLSKGFSFHQKQQQSVKEPIEGASVAAALRVKKSKALTRRWSSLKQYQTTTLSQQSLATGSSTVTSSNPSPQNTAASAVDVNQRNVTNSGSDVTKKKWEVIEHYKGTVNGRDTVSSSLLAVSRFKNEIGFDFVTKMALKEDEKMATIFVLITLINFPYAPLRSVVKVVGT